MKRTKATLASYMNYVSDEGLDLDRFVEHGGRLLGREEVGGLDAGLDDLREKMAGIRSQHPQLARQLEFLAGYFQTETPHTAPNSRNESIFALLYVVKEMDLMPDHMPEVGLLDDLAVVESVLTRNAAHFECHCAAHGVEWAAIRPEPRR